MSHPPTSPERLAIIRRKIEGGATYAQVGRDLGVSRSAIRQICRRYGIVKPPGMARRRRTDRSGEHKQRWLRELHDVPADVVARRAAELKRYWMGAA